MGGVFSKGHSRVEGKEYPQLIGWGEAPGERVLMPWRTPPFHCEGFLSGQKRAVQTAEAAS